MPCPPPGDLPDPVIEPRSKRKRRLDSLEAAQGAPRDPRRDSRIEGRMAAGISWPLEMLIHTPGVSGAPRRHLESPVSSCGASVGFHARHDRELREPLTWCQDSQVSMHVVRGWREPAAMALEAELCPRRWGSWGKESAPPKQLMTCESSKAWKELISRIGTFPPQSLLFWCFRVYTAHLSGAL